MPLALILISIGLITAGVRGTYKQLGALLVADFTGTGSFLNWVAAVGVCGCIGYIPALQKWSRLFIVLVMLAFFLKGGQGFFSQLSSALSNVQGGPAAPSDAPSTSSTSQTGDSQLNTGLAGIMSGTNTISSISSLAKGLFNFQF